MRRAAFLMTALAATVALTGLAEARSKRSNEITVRQRSYLDAGVKVRPGSYPLNYVYVSQGPLSSPVYQHVSSQFGGETLPGRWSLPGR